MSSAGLLNNKSTAKKIMFNTLLATIIRITQPPPKKGAWNALLNTVLPRLVRMRTIKLMSFSGFVSTESISTIREGVLVFSCSFLDLLFRSVFLHFLIKNSSLEKIS